MDIHNKQKRLERLIERIEQSKAISKNNKKLIFDFKRYIEIEETLSVSRVERIVSILLEIAEWMDKDFDKVTKEDMTKLIEKIHSQNYKEWTIYTYKVIIKKFWKWLKKTEDAYPEEVKWIKPRVKNRTHKLPEELLTEEDIKKLIEVADNTRDKAFVAMLYESGCRIGEIATLTIKNVSFPDSYGCIIIVSGKTGDRRIRLIEASSYLAKWISSHPFRDNPESPLWIKLCLKSAQAITYTAFTKILKELAVKADIKKRIHPHLFRHSRATKLANYLTEAQMKEIFGWTQASDMASIYVHLSGRDTDEAILKLHGLKKDAKEVKPKICPRCKHSNPITSDICEQCGLALDVKTAIEMDTIRRFGDEFFMLLMKNPNVQKIADKILRDLMHKKR